VLEVAETDDDDSVIVELVPVVVVVELLDIVVDVLDIVVVIVVVVEALDVVVEALDVVEVDDDDPVLVVVERVVVVDVEVVVVTVVEVVDVVLAPTTPTATALEVTVTGVEASSVTCNSKCHVPVVDRAPVDAVSGPVVHPDANEPPRSL
jgi:hypothetical protein